MKKCTFVLLGFLLSACHTDLKKTPENSDVSLHKVSFNDLTSFKDDHFSEVVPAVTLTCHAIKQNPSFITKSAIKFDTDAYLKACDDFLKLHKKDDPTVQAFIESHFTPYLVTYKKNDTGQFTSYYEAEIRASTKKHGVYQYPIYGQPNDLIEISLKDFDETLPDKRLVGRVEKGKFVPYFDRKDIDEKGIDAPVILWGDDKVDIFLMQIQGSAVAVLDNQKTVRIGYADNNGLKFRGIGRILIDKGLLEPGKASMAEIRDFLKQNPDIADESMDENPRFIFHKITHANGPIGKLGVPLTAGRSLAVDMDFVPLGSFLWLETTAPENVPLNKLVVAQDIGSAIKGAIRGDYFWGHGETALLKAGQMNAQGKYYLLVPND